MNFIVLIPEIIVCLTVLAVIITEWFFPLDSEYKPHSILAYIAGLGLFVALCILLGWRLGGYGILAESYFSGAFLPDEVAWFFRVTLLISGIMSVMISAQYVRDRISHPSEFYALICLATLGAMFMTAAAEFMTFYLGLELLSISSYVLVALKKDRIRASEAALKYLIFGALSSGFLLYGISILFGMTGSLNYAEIKSFFITFVQQQAGLSLPLLLGVLLLLAGLGYKIAAVPFHMWAPDVYQGAPIPVTAFLSTSSKVAGFVALLRILEMLMPLSAIWTVILIILAALSMTLGNLVAIAQKDIKRLFAYSSIAHAGYLLVGIIALSEQFSRDTALIGVLYYLFAYIFMNIGAFAVIIHFSKMVNSTQLNAFSGLGQKAPWLAFVLSCCLISLAGLPPFAGFTGKFFLFGAVINAGPQFIWLAVLGMLNSVVSLYYYSSIIKLLYFGKANEAMEAVRATPALVLVTVISLIGIVLLFIYPAPIINFASGIGTLLL